MEGRKDSIDEVAIYKSGVQYFCLVLMITAEVLFWLTYSISMKYYFKPLNDDQFEQLEQVAYEVYEQKKNYVLIVPEVPEGFRVRDDKTTITVTYASSKYQGKVIAELKNGELVMTRYDESERKMASTMLGVIVASGVVLFIIGIMFRR